MKPTLYHSGRILRLNGFKTNKSSEQGMVLVDFVNSLDVPSGSIFMEITPALALSLARQLDSTARQVMADTGDTEAKYLVEDGVFCPKCGSLSITTAPIKSQTGGAAGDVSCCECGADWLDVYELIGLCNLENENEQV